MPLCIIIFIYISDCYVKFMKKTLYFVIFTVTLSGCTSENTKYVSKENEAASLMKECRHNPNINLTELDNAWQITRIYLNNCNPKTSPSTAIYIGINPYF